MEDMTLFLEDANRLATEIHEGNRTAGWWSNKDTGECMLTTRNRPEIMMLVVSEVAEAAEGYELELKDDKLPEREMAEVELADTAIRLYDLIGAEGIVFTNQPDFVSDEENYPWFANTIEGFDSALMYIVRAVAHAMEGHRKADRAKYENWLQVALFRTYWVAGIFCFDIDSAITEKRAFNVVRPDHKLENRLAEGGKAY